MNRKLMSLIAVCLLAACQRTPETPPAAAPTPDAAAPSAQQNVAAALLRAAFGTAPTPAGLSVLGARVLENGQAALVVSRIPPDSAAAGMRDMALTASISAYLLHKVDGNWQVARRHEAIAESGSRGEAGELTWLALANGRPGFAIVGASENRGQTVKSLLLFDLGAKDMRLLAGKEVLIHSDNDGDCEGERPQCWNVDGAWRLVQKEGQALADLEIDFTGVVEQRPEAATAKAEALAKSAASEPSYDEYIEMLGPRETRRVKATARYALHEGGMRLVSGENAAEGFL